MSQDTLNLEKFWRLAVIVIASGAIVMALEIAGSRIITPIFGSTTYSWGILIGVILSGLSIGYHLGGRVSNFYPDFGKLCSIVFSTGIFIIFIPYISQALIGFFIGVFSNSVVANFFVTLVLFCPPTILAGFVSPYAIKLGTDTLRRVGNISGNLYALATMGSIFGTFFTVFALIPFFEINQIILGLGISLMLVAVIGLKFAPKLILGLIVVTLALNYVIIEPLTAKSEDLLIEKESQYSTLRVVDDNNFRTLYVDGIVHSTMDLDAPNELVLHYTKFFHLANTFNPEFEDVLFIGGGGFSGPKSFLAEYPGVVVDVVEIDPDVIDLAKKYFALPEDPNLTLHAEDARQYLLTTTKKYDVMILDAYSGNHVPFHLLTLEYYQLLSERLNSDGVVISNFIGILEGNDSQLFKANYKTMKEVFPTVHTFPANIKNVDHRQNIAIVALKSQSAHNPTEFLEDGTSCEIYEGLECDELKTNYLVPEVVDDIPVLTDQFSPVDHLAGYFVQSSASGEVLDTKYFEELLTGNLVVQMGLSILVVGWVFIVKQIWLQKLPITDAV